ncbi:MAG: hypothetical protein LUG91_11070 [Ruminococcus sp.]|nr:hypothetical protein [Ruminococcus sp.]
MSRVSGGQLAALLLITDAFALLCLMGNASAAAACGFLTGVVLQFFLALPAAYYYKNGGTLKDAPKAFAWYYLIYLIWWGGMLFVMLWNVSGDLSIPAENFSFIPEKLLISGAIALTCLYVSSPGIKALSRSAVITAAVGAVFLAVVIISSFIHGKIEYLTDISGSDGFFGELGRGFVLSGGLGSFIVLLGFTRGNPVKCTLGYFIGKAVLFTAVPLAAAAVAGGVMEITEFPVIFAAELSQPFSSQRIDSLFLIIFVIMAVFAISLQTAAASYLISLIFPSFRKLRSTLALVLMIGDAFLMHEIYQYSSVYVTAVLAAVIAVPLLMILSRKRERRS